MNIPIQLMSLTCGAFPLNCSIMNRKSHDNWVLQTGKTSGQVNKRLHPTCCVTALPIYEFRQRETLLKKVEFRSYKIIRTTTK